MEMCYVYNKVYCGRDTYMKLTVIHVLEYVKLQQHWQQYDANAY